MSHVYQCILANTGAAARIPTRTRMDSCILTDGTHRTETSMPSKLTDKCKNEWISAELYESANKYITEFEKTVYIDTEDRKTLCMCMYFISRTQMVEEEKREKRISDKLVSHFEATLEGQEC